MDISPWLQPPRPAAPPRSPSRRPRLQTLRPIRLSKTSGGYERLTHKTIFQKHIIANERHLASYTAASAGSLVEISELCCVTLSCKQRLLNLLLKSGETRSQTNCRASLRMKPLGININIWGIFILLHIYIEKTALPFPCIQKTMLHYVLACVFLLCQRHHLCDVCLCS